MTSVNRSAYPATYSTSRSAPTPHVQPVVSPPPGTFAPGTKIQIGTHRTVIQRYLSEGGFAHVYVVQILSSERRDEIAVLKRVAVPDKDALASMRTEVETMKKLRGTKHIVQYIDSHASQLRGGGFEVFLLMEFCGGGGLIDFMNTRLQHRLTEPEILKIFGDVCQGVATMHYLQPPLLHRDLKVENVLISKSSTSPSTVLYKLCDFGSTALTRQAATNAAEARSAEEDVQRHTTMQYRSPEMVDVWRRQPIDEKSDIWALGVLLYKLCYYTTPFEEVGQMAILTATYKFPSNPAFSSRLRGLIGSMLSEDPRQRPNIYQVVCKVCSMTGETVPLKDIYSNRSERTDVPEDGPTIKPTALEPATLGISHTSPQPTEVSLPSITPMRRGRIKPASATPTLSAPKAQKDPFDLDTTSTKSPFSALEAEDVAQKYPSIDDFAIAHDATRGKDHTTKMDSPKLPDVVKKQQSSSSRETHMECDKSSDILEKPKQRPIWRVPDGTESSKRESKFSTDRLRSVEDVATSQDGPQRIEKETAQAALDSSPLIDISDGVDEDLKSFQVTKSIDNRLEHVIPTTDVIRRDSQPLLDLSNTDEPVRTKGGDNSQEMLRERQRLEADEEEKRVAQAATEYRGTRGRANNRSSTIQARMQSLMTEGQRAPSKRTAEGYGHYTDSVADGDTQSKPSVERSGGSEADVEQLQGITTHGSSKLISLTHSVSAPSTLNHGGARPAPKPRPKPNHKPSTLDTRPLSASPVINGPSPVVKSSTAVTPTTKRLNYGGLASASSPKSRLAALLEKDQEGVAAPGAGSPIAGSASTTRNSPVHNSALDERSFSTRYPSIGGLDAMIVPSPVGSEDIRDV